MNYQHLADLINQHSKIVILQADNPDADSLATSLALEQIFGDMGKEPYLYCAIDMPEYLRYLQGWDRVHNELPPQFDMSIIVDASTISLFERLQDGGKQGWVASRPCVVLDHHATTADDIPFATLKILDDTKVSTGELIYEVGTNLQWPMNVQSLSLIMTSILADSMGLATENTSPQTYRVMAELVEKGVNRPELEEQRREFNKMDPEIFRYKAQLIERTELVDDCIAFISIPQDEIYTYSPLYNPAPLIQQEHLQTSGVKISIVLKSYDNGRVTGAIRCAFGNPIAAKLAEHFGGGGHDYAAGFKLEGKPLAEVKQECIDKTRQLIEDDL